MPKWTASDIPDQSGRTIVITGANSGLGLVSTEALAAKGARIIMACRSLDKGRIAMEQVRSAVPKAHLELRPLDLADLSSIEAFAESHGDQPIDVLMNNAGIMAIPRRETADGFEMQIGTNHFGHFALTGRLLPALEAAAAPRIVTLSSGAHQMGAYKPDDLMREDSYGAWEAYGQSKLANLLFTYELDRRLQSADKRSIAVAAHPGYAATNLQSAGPRMRGGSTWFWDLMNRVFAQPAEMGALPQLYAATTDVDRGAYYGPGGLFESRGYPTRVESNARSHDEGSQRHLWEQSVELTGVDFGGI